jgi:hypothetical protein
VADELPIVLDQAAEANGLANMLFDLIRQNLEQKPHKRRDFDALSGRVTIQAHDIEVEVTLDFGKGRLRILDGARENPMLSIRTDHETILDLSLIGIRMGLPNYFDSTGRGILKKLLSGKLKIGGLWRSPVALTRLTRLISVN